MRQQPQDRHGIEPPLTEGSTDMRTTAESCGLTRHRHARTAVVCERQICEGSGQERQYGKTLLMRAANFADRSWQCVLQIHDRARLG